MADREPRQTRVLVVDDSPAEADRLCAMLRGRGDAATAVRTVSAAAEALAADGFDCVLLDLTLPDTDALGALRQLAATTAVPVVVLTGRCDEDLALAAIAAGADDYLLKGDLGPALLGRAVRYAIERRNARDTDTAFRRIVESLGEGVVVHDRDGTLRLANAAARRLLGVDPSALPRWLHAGTAASGDLFRTDGSVLPPDEYPARRSMATGEAVTATVGVCPPGEGMRWLQVRHVPVDPAALGGIALITSLADVTATVAAEHEVASARRKVQLVARDAADAWAVVGPDGTIREWSHPGAHPSPDQPVPPGTPLVDLVDDTHRGVVTGLLAEAAASPGTAVRGEIRRSGPGAGRSWFEIVLTDWCHEPAVGGIICTLRDVTHFVEAERAKRALSEIVESSEDAILSVGLDGRILTWNQAATRLYGYGPDEAVGVRLESLLHRSVVSAYRQARRRRAARAAWTRHSHPDGSQLWAAVTVSPVLDPDGAVTAVSIIARDVTERHRLQRDLRADRRRLANAQRVAGVGSIEWELPAGQASWSDEARRILGVLTDGPGVADYLATVVPDERDRVDALLRELATGAAGATCEFVHPFTRPDGSGGWVKVVAAVLEGDPGEPNTLVLTMLDTTAIETSRQRYRRAEQRARTAFEQAAMGVAMADRVGRLTEVNPAACSILGRPADELLGTTLADHALDADTDGVRAADLTSFKGGVRHRGEFRVRAADGSPRWVAVTTSLVSEDGGGSYWFQQMADVTAAKHAERLLEEASMRDGLTGLPNRALFTERLGQALARAEAADSRLAVLFLDIDRFKLVNDSWGHGVGDRLLRQVADRLSSAVGTGTVARFSGDEFVVALAETASYSEALDQAARLIEAANGHFELDGATVYVTVSAGVALSGPGTTPEGLIRNADLAMHRAKKAGGARTVAFDERDLSEVRQRAELERDIRTAITEEAITLAYQPIVAADDGRLVGAEALVRWDHPQRGPIRPDVFVPLAAAVGYMGELTEQVLTGACRQTAAWLADGVVDDGFRMSVNLAAEDLVDPELAPRVERILTATGLAATHLGVEVTETGLIDDTDAALAGLRALRQLGVRVSVDDFGTGYSSLGYLRMFPVDVVKLDRSFIAGLGRDPEATALVRGILALTSAIGLQAVAEGVEDELQLQALRQLGCAMGQGYLWSRPVPPDAFAEFARVRRHPVAAAPVTAAVQAFVERHEVLGWEVVDALPAAVCVLDPDGDVVATNRRWQEVVVAGGADPSRCGPGANYLQVCDSARGPGADDAALVARGLRALLGGDRDSFTFEYGDPGAGATGRFLMLGRPLAGGGAVITHLDITDRHRAERALAESEFHLRGIFETLPIGVVRLDAHRRVVDVNGAFCRLVGRPAEELHGCVVDDLLGPAGTGETGTDGAAEDGSAPARPGHHQIIRPDGDVRIGRAHEVTVADRSGARTHVATVEDITDYLRMSEELRRSHEVEALGRLAGGIAHEINTPTQFLSDNLTFLTDAWAAVLNLLDAVQRAVDDLRRGEDGDILTDLETAVEACDLAFLIAELPGALSQSRDGVERVAGIVRAMKAFGHRDRRHPEPVDLNRIVADTVTLTRNELRHVADVELDLAGLPPVTCFPSAVGQALVNLLVNAADAVAERGPQRGRVTVSTRPGPDGVVVRITDTGTGIPEHVLPHIFEPYFTTKPLGKGTGQGLAVAWSTFVDHHGGTIAVHPSTEGTCVEVTLPLVPPTAGLDAVGGPKGPSEALVGGD